MISWFAEKQLLAYLPNAKLHFWGIHPPVRFHRILYLASGHKQGVLKQGRGGGYGYENLSVGV